jgi:hypothetical protein
LGEAGGNSEEVRGMPETGRDSKEVARWSRLVGTARGWVECLRLAEGEVGENS